MGRLNGSLAAVLLKKNHLRLATHPIELVEPVSTERYHRGAIEQRFEDFRKLRLFRIESISFLLLSFTRFGLFNRSPQDATQKIVIQASKKTKTVGRLAWRGGCGEERPDCRGFGGGEVAAGHVRPCRRA